MRDLALRAPPSLSVAEGATTPTADTGVIVWSTSTNGLMTWNGSAWVRLARGRLAINAQTGTTYTFAAADARETLTTLSNASAITATVPPSVFGAGDVIPFMRIGAGQVTIVPGSGMTQRPSSAETTRAQWSLVSLLFLSATEYVVTGDRTVS